MDTLYSHDMNGCSLTNRLELTNVTIKEKKKTEQTFGCGAVKDDVSASKSTLLAIGINEQFLLEDPSLRTNDKKSQGADGTLQVAPFSRKRQYLETMSDTPLEVEMRGEAAPDGNISDGSDGPPPKNRKREAGNIERATVRESEVSSRGEGASTSICASAELGVDGVKEKLVSSGGNRYRKRRQVAAKERKKPKTRRKVAKSRRSPPHRMGTRRNQQELRPSTLEFLEYKFPLIRWPLTDRPERPEYPSCMEGAEEGLAFNVEDCSDESSGSEEGPFEWSCPYEGLEACIVPGTLEAVVVFCRTSPVLPPPLRPDPERLRDLLHDSCVLQCILRGVAPANIAAYLDSETSKSSPTDMAHLSDAAIFIGE